MKTFTSIKRNETAGYYPELNSTVYVVEADPKREGFYKMTSTSVFNTSRKSETRSFLYGKCNQDEIIERTKTMIELPLSPRMGF